MERESLAVVKNLCLMDDTFMSKCLENAPGRGQDMYMFDRMDRKSGLDFGDGAHVIYANGMWRGDDALGRLMHDFNCSDAAEMYFDILKRRVSQFKNSEEGRHIMCKAVEEFAEKIAERREALGEARGVERGKAEGIAEGVERGKRETMLATAKRMLKDGVLALKDIARYTGLSLAQVKKLQPTVA